MQANVIEVKPTANGSNDEKNHSDMCETSTSSSPENINNSIIMESNEMLELFEKRFTYQQPSNTKWQLPPADLLYNEYYQLDTLQALKKQLNCVKSKLNDYSLEEWRAHTRRNDPAGQVQWLIKNETCAELATVAWCKFYECLHQYSLVQTPKLNTLHLCEAPGAFIAALNHYLYTTYKRDEVQWNWLATTLNPYHEGNSLDKMIIDDRFVLYTLDHWLFHDDFTGNIISRTNIEQMQRECEKRLPDGVQLITADGSIDCVDMPDSQEEEVALLHYAEICVALSILADGGNFILKLFTLFEACTVSKLYLLNCVFEEVHVFKPATSKRGNSENYIVCKGYRKHSLPNFEAILELMKSKLCLEKEIMPMFCKAHLPKEFLLQHEACVRRFMMLQINAIESNICAFELRTHAETRRTRKIRKYVANEYFRRYKIKPLPTELTILHKRQGSGSMPKCITTFLYKGSYSERKDWKRMTVDEKLFALRKQCNELERALLLSVGGRFEDILLQQTSKLCGQPNLELRKYSGAQYEKLRSSTFAALHILLLRNLVYHYYDEEPLQQVSPKCTLFETLSKETVVMRPSTETTKFSKIERDFIYLLIMAILRHQPKKIVFENYAFLTHLAVSTLRFMSLNFFQQMTIATHPQLEIILQGCKYDEKRTKELLSLMHLMEEDANVLCVVDIENLHYNEFCSALKAFNNLLLLSGCKVMLMC